MYRSSRKANVIGMFLLLLMMMLKLWLLMKLLVLWLWLCLLPHDREWSNRSLRYGHKPRWQCNGCGEWLVMLLWLPRTHSAAVVIVQDAVVDTVVRVACWHDDDDDESSVVVVEHTVVHDPVVKKP